MNRDDSPQPRQHWRDWPFVIGLFVSSRLLVGLAALLGPLLFKTDQYFFGYVTAVGWPTYLNRWDVGWYGRVALDGYSYIPGAESNVAFFPLFPLLLRTFHFI